MTQIVRHIALALITFPSLVAFTPAIAGEVTKFELEFFEGSSPMVTNYATVWVSDRTVRVEQRRTALGQTGPILIYRGDLGRFYSVDVEAKAYSQFERRQVASLTLDMRRARLVVEQQLSRLPSDQQKAFKRMLGLTNENSGVTQIPAIVTPSDVEGKVAGLTCARATITRDEEVLGQTCVADWGTLGLVKADIEVFRELANFKREMMGASGLTPLELVPDQPFDLVTQFDGLPLSYNRVVDGQPRSAIRVKAIEKLAAAGSLFEIPENFAFRSGRRAFLSQLGIEGPAEIHSSPARAADVAEPEGEALP